MAFRALLIVLLALCGASITELSAAGETAKRSVLACDFYLVGGFEAGSWLGATSTAPLLHGGEKYKKCSLQGVASEEVTGGKTVLETGPGEYLRVPFTPAPPEPEYDKPGIRFSKELYLNCPWNPIPRIPVVQGHPDKSYAGVIEGILGKEKLRQPKIVFEQVLRIDLEGDGVEEVIITASSIQDDHLPVYGRKGDYSLVLLRKLIDGKVENIVINLDAHPADQPSAAEDGSGKLANKFFVPLIADLDGDGVLEIVCEGRYYEGGWYEIFKVKGRKVERVLSEGVGA